MERVYTADSFQISNPNDLTKIEKLWKSIDCGKDMTVFQTYEWNRLLIEEFYDSPKEVRLFSKVKIYVGRNKSNEHNAIIIPLIIQNHTNLYRRKGIYLLGHGSYSDYLNAVYLEFNSSVFEVLIQKIRSDYRGMKFYFQFLLSNTDCNEYLRGKYSIYSKTAVVGIDVSQKSDEYMKKLSKSTRQNLRTAFNRMNKDGYEYIFDVYGPVSDTKMLSALRDIHMNRLIKKNTESQSANDNEKVAKTVIKKYIRRIRLKTREYNELNNNIVLKAMQTLSNSCLVVVRLNNEFAGYIYGLKEEHTIRIIQNCVEEKFYRYSPMFKGIFDFLIKCCEDENIMSVDFTRGDEDYKIKLGGEIQYVNNYII